MFLFVFYLFFYLAMIKWERVYALVQGGVRDHEVISIRCSFFFFFFIIWLLVDYVAFILFIVIYFFIYLFLDSLSPIT